MAKAALLFAVAALLVRAPSLLFVELNWDEALYWRIAGELVQGHAPYAGTWDRKPPGLFVVLAALRALGGDDMIVLRLGTVAAVVASALALRSLARRLMPMLPGAGVAAGLLYIAFSMHGAGDGANAELLLAPFALWAMALALGPAGGRAGVALGSGVLGGCAVLIKQVALAEAAVTFLLLLALPALRGEGRPGWVPWRQLALMALGALVPAGLLLAWYAAIGKVPLLVSALGAAEDAGGAVVDTTMLRGGVRAYAAPLLGAVAGIALLLAPRRGALAQAAGAAVALWTALVGCMLLVLGRFADHMLLQVLPPLAMGCAAAGALALRALPPRWAGAAGLSFAALALAWGVGAPARAGAEVAWRRHVDGIAHWGDRTATLAAVLRPRLDGPGDLFVVSRMLGLYHETGCRPPTRFPFVLHLWNAYAPVDGAAELDRILASRPGFVVVDDLWLPGGPRMGETQARLLERLAQRLDQDYVRDGGTGRFRSRGGGFIGGGVGAVVFRRADRPPLAPREGHLVYAAAP